MLHQIQIEMKLRIQMQKKTICKKSGKPNNSGEKLFNAKWATWIE
jgi:hypothetical protein